MSNPTHQHPPSPNLRPPAPTPSLPAHPGGDQTQSSISDNPRQSAAKKRGGARPGAGAPRGNLNALKHGRRSRQFAQIGALLVADPALLRSLLDLAARRGRRAIALARGASLPGRQPAGLRGLRLPDAARRLTVTQSNGLACQRRALWAAVQQDIDEIEAQGSTPIGAEKWPQ